jgi:hypothetical protein
MVISLRSAVVAALLSALAVQGFAAPGFAAEKFRRLSGKEINARFAGMELSDDVHWRDVYERDGTLKSQSMGKQRAGKWSVKGDQLCIELGADTGGCYDVWLAGSNAEFRREGLDGAMLEGRLGRLGSGDQTTKGKRQ